MLIVLSSVMLFMSSVEFLGGLCDLALLPFANISNVIIGIPVCFMAVCALFGLVSRLMNR